MKGRLRDLTNVETIYRRDIRTVRIRLRRTFARSEDVELNTIATPADVHELLRAIFAGLEDDQEHFVILVLDAAAQVTGYSLIGSGMQDRVHVDVRFVFRKALLLGAQGIIIAHNHPTGVLVPSRADLELTVELVRAGRLLDIAVLDHVILGQGEEHLSLRITSPALFVMSDNEPGA
jgi:DNA repair protein RadC